MERRTPLCLQLPLMVISLGTFYSSLLPSPFILRRVPQRCSSVHSTPLPFLERSLSPLTEPPQKPWSSVRCPSACSFACSTVHSMLQGVPSQHRMLLVPLAASVALCLCLHTLDFLLTSSLSPGSPCCSLLSQGFCTQSLLQPLSPWLAPHQPLPSGSSFSCSPLRKALLRAPQECT